MRKQYCCLLLILFLLAGRTCACADPDLTLRDTASYPGPWAEAYSRILAERAEGIRAYQDYVAGITSAPACRAVGLTDLTSDGIPELLFLELEHETEYGFDVGCLRIYTSDGEGARCVLSLRPEIDDLLYSGYYLAENGVLTVRFSDCEMGWILQLRPDMKGYYTAETTLVEQEDFSGEGPDYYYVNGGKISAKKYRSLEAEIRAGQGTEIGSLQVDDGGYGFTHTLAEAQEALSSGEIPGAEQPARTVSGLPRLSFFTGSFTAGQRFDVYSAPSARSWRGANGKAAITSGSEILVAGTEGDWILILYELDSGVARAGYIDSRKIKGEYTAGVELSFSRTQASLAEAAVFTDDPVRQKSTIGRLKKGTKVTCLAEYRGWIYVEAKVSGKTARGFIPASSIGPAE